MRGVIAFLGLGVLLASCSSPVRSNVGDASASVDGAARVDLLKVDLLDCPPCSGNTPVCNPKTLQCVGCLVDGDCPEGHLCMANACHAGCSQSHSSCEADAGACDVDLGICRGCLTDKECGGQTPRCDAMSGHCVACLPANDNCPKGDYCTDSFTCAPGCKLTADCATDGGQSLACCNHACVDLRADQGNCGACGTACNGTSCCGGVCVDEKMDPANCGGCGKGCSFPNAVPGCMNGSCTIAACAKGFSDCNGSPNDGCEIFLSGDLANCGMCGHACGNIANATPACVAGSCVIASCGNGFTDCDQQFGDGCEANTKSDPNNCGFCGVQCGMGGPNTLSVTCAAGQCTLVCTNGFADCDKMPGDGCEATVSNSVTNCGGCGVNCTLAPNVATATCANGLCGIVACKPGFGDCDGVAANGCESTLASDPNNCGMCGKACALTANVATTKCAASVCAVATCAAGFADCNGTYADGCEINLTNDTNHCGACATVCPNNGACTNGMCPNNGKVLIAAADNASALTGLQTKLQGTGAFATVDTFNLVNATPTLAQLKGYGAVITWTQTQGGIDEATFMNNLADYFDAGGRVVMAVFKIGGYPAGPKGRFDSPNGPYMLFNITQLGAYASIGAQTIGTVNEPNSPLMVGVVAPTSTGFVSTEPLLNGAVVVANWKSGKPFIVRGVTNGRNRVDLNLWPDPTQWGGDSINAIKNALLF